MTHDEAEFLISQRLDGTLDAAEDARLRAAIDADAIVAAMWREHQTIDAALRATRVVAAESAGADDFVARIAARIDADESSVAMPQTSFKLSDYRWATPLAAAAMLAIGVTIGVFTARPGQSARMARNEPNRTPPAVESVANAIPTITLNGGIDESTLEGSAANGVANISVGTPAGLTPSYVSNLYLSDRYPTDRIVIQGLGRTTPDVFE